MATRIPARTKWLDRPTWPFGVNWQSWEAQGLQFWVPFGSAPAIDLIGGNRLGGRAGGALTGTTGAGPMGSMGWFGPSQKIGPPGTTNALSFTNKRGVNLPGGRAITMCCWALFYRAPSAAVAYNIIDWVTAAAAICTRFSTAAAAGSPLVATHDAKTRTTNEGVVSDVPYFLAWTDNNDPVDSAAMHIYRNGVECGYASSTNGVAGTNTLGEVTLGGVRNPTAGNMFGVIADCRIYNYQMSPYQIQMLYEGTSKWDLYWKPSPWLSVTAASTFLPRLSVLGAG